MIRTIRQSFRRKKKPKVPESTQPPEWQQDETAVQAGSCKFHVKYLGCVEVQDSRGMQVCEQAVKQLKSELRKSRTSRMFGRGRKKKIKAILYVSPDALRVVEDSSKALLLDQTIEKVSFCAPDRNYNRAFSYICRDGTTRRWICHSFFAIKDSGERLSHAVGCAFAACLEKKQKRERDTSGVTARYDSKRTMFTREGSFRPKMESEIEKPSTTEITEVPADVHSSSSSAVPRPHAPLHLLRQASLRNFSNKKMFAEGDINSPFKRNLSLRVNELPSTITRQQVMNPVPEDEWENEMDTHFSGQTTNAFSMNDDPFTKAPPISKPISAVSPTQLNGCGDGGLRDHSLSIGISSDKPKPLNSSGPTATSPVRETNPWASDIAQHQTGHKRTPSEADQWLLGLQSKVQGQQVMMQHNAFESMSMMQRNLHQQQGIMPMSMNKYPMNQQPYGFASVTQNTVFQPQSNAFMTGM